MEEQIVDVLTKPLARVKFEYFRENLAESMSLSDMVDVFIPWSDISAEPF